MFGELCFSVSCWELEKTTTSHHECEATVGPLTLETRENNTISYVLGYKNKSKCYQNGKMEYYNILMQEVQYLSKLNIYNIFLWITSTEKQTIAIYFESQLMIKWY